MISLGRYCMKYVVVSFFAEVGYYPKFFPDIESARKYVVTLETLEEIKVIGIYKLVEWGLKL